MTPSALDRDAALEHLRTREAPWDILVVGGGATGVGVAIDGAARGYEVALLEGHDFGKGTSSRSTKLIHGGVRYLQQGNIALVTEALRERGRLRRNAPHLVHDLSFVVPNYQWWEAPFYGIGMKVYDALAGRYGFGRSHLLSREAVLEHLPNIETDGLRGGVLYHDGQFDDARLLVHMAWTAAEQGAVLANYVRVTDLLGPERDFINGVRARDEETGQMLEVRARCVVNATGPFADQIRRLDEPGASPMLRPSQGVHIVLPRRFLAGDSAIMVPRTVDQRVLFAIPWHDVVLVGTTDTPIEEVTVEPRHRDEETAFLLRTAARYLEHDPTPEDVLSVFTGIRPLVAEHEGDSDTASISREHVIHVSRRGLLTVAGGKWTTYRKMAEDVVDQAAILAGLDARRCPTRDLPLHGHSQNGEEGPLAVHGADRAALEQLATDTPSLAAPLHPRLPYRGVDVVWAARHEMARSVEDVLARRTRALLLDARAAMEAAPAAAALLARELGHDEAWARGQAARFAEQARGYLLTTP